MIQGGSTSVGLFAIQLAHIAGYRVIATCSPHSFDLVKSYGADHVVDYHDAEAAVKEIKEVTDDGVIGALECVGGMACAKLAVESLGPKGGLVTGLSPVPEGFEKIRGDVKMEGILMYTLFGYVSSIHDSLDRYGAELCSLSICTLDMRFQQCLRITPGS